MAQNAHGPLPGSSGPSLDHIRGQRIEAQLPQQSDFTQARLRVRAIVAARRIEDNRREAEWRDEDRRREFDDALDVLREIEPVIARAAEVLDNYAEAAEELLALLLALVPNAPRELTDVARKATHTVPGTAHILNQLANQLGAAIEQLDDGGAP